MYSNQCVIGMVIFGLVVSKWGLMKVWLSILERPVLVVRSK
jgi:hypothetical protein